MRVTLANVHSDNFGDYLNAQTTQRFVEERLGASVSTALYAGTAWRTRVPLRGDVDHLSSFALFENAVDDLLHHQLQLDHECRNEELWSIHQRVVDETDLLISVPSGEAIGIYRDPRFLVPFVAASVARVPSMMFYGTTASSGSSEFDDLAILALRDAHVRVRDRASVAHMRGRGMRVFGGVDPTFLEAANRADRLRKPKRAVISLVLGDTMEWHPFATKLANGVSTPSTLDTIIEAIRRLTIPEGFTLELVPHSPLEAEIDVLEETRTRMGEHRPIEVRRDIGSVDDYIEAIATSTAVVSLRYHGALIALAADTPVVAVAYEEKIVGLMRWAGSQDTCFHIDDLDPERLAAAVSKLARGEIGRDGSVRLERLRAEVEAQLVELSDALVAAPLSSSGRPLLDPWNSSQALPVLCGSGTYEGLLRGHLEHALRRNQACSEQLVAGLARERGAQQHMTVLQAALDHATDAYTDALMRERKALERIAALELELERVREAG